MKFINKEQLQSRLSDRNNLINRLADPRPRVEAPIDRTLFKSDGTLTEQKIFSDAEKAAIGITAIIASPQQAAEEFGCSPSSASKFASGNSSNTVDLIRNEERNAQLRSDIYNGLGEIREKARSKLLGVLDKIEPNDIDGLTPAAKLSIASSVAAKLSTVIDRTIEKGANFADQRSAHLHLYSPEQKAKETYTIKTVGAKIPLENTGEAHANIIDVEPTGQEAQ